MLIPAANLLRLGILNQHRSSSQSIWANGLGEINASNLLTGMQTPDGTAGVFSMVLLANIPQLLVAVAYFMLDAILTCMLGAVEYDSYARKRRYLRVSWPRGKQRPTYYLSLPYRYSLPLLVFSAVWHWLVSQSLFFAEIIPVDLDGSPFESQYSSYSKSGRIVTCGYSPVAIIFAIVVGMALLLVSMLLGLRRFHGPIPLAGLWSAAISAACHPPPLPPNIDGNVQDHALKPVMWGDTGAYQPSDPLEFRNRLGGRNVAGEVGHGVESGFFHRSFSADEVETPSGKRLYI